MIFSLVSSNHCQYIHNVTIVKGKAHYSYYCLIGSSLIFIDDSDDFICISRLMQKKKKSSFSLRAKCTYEYRNIPKKTTHFAFVF